ncbi:MAG: YbhB/YbcL family Raf kinase inhibitor-like protein [Candidatus Aenigmarchaeota archaeon]|nr:YbhB/YbcL family Raf kinase inhibitor-like protein [Candidatus Aenigmarchaeota archaeon]
MKLSSPAFKDHGPIPAKYTCDGDDRSPELHIDDVPEGTESLVLIMEDPDVPTVIRSDRMWNHWVVWNIPAHTKKIPEGAKIGVEGENTWGRPGYGGPCPPAKHRYFFKLYALDTKLHLQAGSTKSDLLAATEGHVLDEAQLMGTYERE